MNGAAYQSRTRERAASPHFIVGNTLAAPVRLAHGLMPLIQVLNDAGHPTAPLLATADIPPFALEDPTYRIRIAQETSFIAAALAQLERPDAGLIVGQRYHMVNFGVLGLAAASAPTVRDLLRTLLRYPMLSWGMCHCALRRDGKDATLQLEPHEAASAGLRFYVERDLACTVTLLRDMLGTSCPPLHVRFRHPAPMDRRPYESFFGCAVEFGASANELRFAADVWQRRPPQADPASFRYYDDQCRRMSEGLLVALDYTDVVRSRLRSMVPMPSLAALAAALCVTERTLQRRLTAARTSFSELLREVRFEQARRLMRRGHVQIDEIAWQLGFEDPIAFSHAFKGWTGQSPRDYRRALRICGAQ
ncbi:MAG TPA: AraC family transcriptional regulator [Gammaproteobacteria bacterium]|nr:AraC family transcriptional regulator [Gammaproteobacteria bacterium]